jgi:superfamily II DNA or RNA helicase
MPRKPEARLLDVNALQLWQHQKDAIRDIAYYLENYNQKSFLVKMPTGTGKTGVFACLCRVAYPELNYLIITPSTALKFQIEREVGTDFWIKIKKSLESLPDQIVETLLPTDVDDIVKQIRGKQFILVTTIQALQAIAANDKYKDVYEELQQRTDCLIFDEGHKEPAYTWGETVRSFKKPTVLFSATPYRNDYKIFDIDKSKFFSLDHQFCTKKHILRELVIEAFKPQQPGPAGFVNELLSAIYKLDPILQKQGITSPKVIIRCESGKDIEKIVAALRKLKKKVIGIHDTFPTNQYYADEVPSKQAQANYQFFVHQFKLIEGIDNPDFCIVALYADFKNTRLLIQQIGRVLRNPGLQSGQKAFLFGLDKTKLQDEWQKYLDYDHLIDQRGKLFDITDVLKVNRDASTLYFSGAFRDLIDVKNISLIDALLFQKKINAFYPEITLTFKALSNLLLEEWEKRDYYVLKTEIIQQNKLLILYIKYENSPIVKEGIFIEQTLALTFLRFDQDYVFYYDSEGNTPMYQINDLTPVPREELEKLFKDKRYINKVFLKNTDIGGRQVRNKELQAGAVENTAPGLADHSYFPSRLEGTIYENGALGRRYVGFQNGRIADFNNKRLDFGEYQAWLDFMKTLLLQKITTSKATSFFSRFAQKVNPPLNPQPASILLDIDSESLEQYQFGENLDNVFFEDVCALINNNTFELTVNDQSFTFGIKYQKDYTKFVLESMEFGEMVQSVIPDEGNLLNYLNANQSFRIVLTGNEYVYAFRNFFRPGQNLISKNKNLDINQIFRPHSCISKIRSEKGSKQLKVSGNLWHKDTLFGLIARSGSGYQDAKLEADFDFDYLLCDDLNSELGDFIGLDIRNNRVVFIHAKAKYSKISASNFQEVCGQATKNLDYLTPYFDRTPTANIKKWDAPWSHKDIGVVNSRMIKGGLNAKQFWSKYISLMSNPNTSREVWLFVGDMFDYASFKREINKKDIQSVKSEVVQLVYLLRATWDSVASVGAQLKIYC